MPSKAAIRYLIHTFIVKKLYQKGVFRKSVYIWYTLRMSKNVLIAGKDLPAAADFANGMLLADNNVALAVNSEDEQNEVPAGVKAVNWNKSSAVSARSVIIQAETKTGFIDDFILYFDSAFFASKFKDFSNEVCARSADEMISSFQYLALEALNRIQQHKTKSRIIFVLKSQPSCKDVALSPNLKSSVENPSNPFVAASEAAFATFAENTAVLSSTDQNLQVLLVTGDETNETMQKDSDFASWLNSYINASDELKNKPSLKASVNWVKAGAKNPGGFSLFK